jgi:hypothetical protein
MQPEAELHESVVQGLPSSQLICVPPHAPLVHVSLVVHALLSLHVPPVTFVWTQPDVVLQLSVVQELLSLQLSAAPPTHAPDAQVSAVVHASLSLHVAVLLV